MEKIIAFSLWKEFSFPNKELVDFFNTCAYVIVLLKNFSLIVYGEVKMVLASNSTIITIILGNKITFN
jgi:hypothetical protein